MHGRRFGAAASAIVGAVIVAVVVLQDGSHTSRPEELAQAALGSWARDHSADPNKSPVHAAHTTKLVLTAVDAREDEERFFRHEMERDKQHGASSAVHAVTVKTAAPAPVGSWAFDHEQKAAQIKAAVATGHQEKKAAAQLHLSLLARQAEARPVEMLSGKAGEEATLQHLAYVSSAMQQETSDYRKSLHGGVMGLKQQQQMVQGELKKQGGYGGVRVQQQQQQQQPGAWAEDHARAQARSQVSATSSELAKAEHLSDVKVVQQAVMKHEGVKKVKAQTAGSWKVDHGSAAQAAAQAGAVPPSAPAQKLAANIQHTFGRAVAVATGGWAQDHSGHSMLELHAAKMGGVERTSAPTGDEQGRAALLLHEAEHAADKRSLELARGAVQAQAQLGSWAADHGANDGRQPKPSKAQIALKRGFSHEADAEAVEAGFVAHGDKARHARARHPAPQPGSWVEDH